MEHSMQDSSDVENAKTISFATIKNANQSMHGLVDTFKEEIEKLYVAELKAETESDEGTLAYSKSQCQRAFIEEMEKWAQDTAPIQASIDQLLEWITASLSEGLQKQLNKMEMVEQVKLQRKQLQSMHEQMTHKQGFGNSRCSQTEQGDVRLPAIMSPVSYVGGRASIQARAMPTSEKLSFIEASLRSKARMLELSSYKDTRVTRYRKLMTDLIRKAEHEEEEKLRLRCRKMGIHFDAFKSRANLRQSPKMKHVSMATKRRLERLQQTELIRRKPISKAFDKIAKTQTCAIPRKSKSSKESKEFKEITTEPNKKETKRPPSFLPPLPDHVTLNSATVSCTGNFSLAKKATRLLAGKSSAPNNNYVLSHLKEVGSAEKLLTGVINKQTSKPNKPSDKKVDYNPKTETVYKHKKDVINRSILKEVGKKTNIKTKCSSTSITKSSHSKGSIVASAKTTSSSINSDQTKERRKPSNQATKRPPWNANSKRINSLKINSTAQNNKREAAKQSVQKEMNPHKTIDVDKKKLPGVLQKATERAMNVFRQKFQSKPMEKSQAKHQASDNNVKSSKAPTIISTSTNTNVKRYNMVERYRERNKDVKQSSKSDKKQLQKTTKESEEFKQLIEDDYIDDFEDDDSYSSELPCASPSNDSVFDPDDISLETLIRQKMNEELKILEAKKIMQKNTDNETIEKEKPQKEDNEKEMNNVERLEARAQARATRVQAALAKNNHTSPSDTRVNQLIQKYSNSRDNIQNTAPSGIRPDCAECQTDLPSKTTERKLIKNNVSDSIKLRSQQNKDSAMDQVTRNKPHNPTQRRDTSLDKVTYPSQVISSKGIRNLHSIKQSAGATAIKPQIYSEESTKTSRTKQFKAFDQKAKNVESKEKKNKQDCQTCANKTEQTIPDKPILHVKRPRPADHKPQTQQSSTITTNPTTMQDSTAKNSSVSTTKAPKARIGRKDARKSSSCILPSPTGKNTDMNNSHDELKECLRKKSCSKHNIAKDLKCVKQKMPTFITV